MKKTQKYINIFSFILIFIFTLYISGIGKPYILPPYDASDYWKRGRSLWSEGNFSFANIDGFRGYFYPLYLGFCEQLGGITPFIILNSAIISFFFIFVVPMLIFEQKFIEAETVKIRLFAGLNYLFFVIFFWGLIKYPLSDLMAFILCSVSVLLLNRIISLQFSSKLIVAALFAGVCMYLTYNVRTIYMFADVCLIIILLIYIVLKKAKVIQKIFILISTAGGAFLAAIPQIKMNLNNLNHFSVQVPTNNLMLNQLFWGIQYQRYETYIGDTSIHPVPQLYFLDAVGSSLCESTGITEFTTWGDFFLFLIKHPFEIGGIYVRHFINGLFPCWPSQYVTKLDNIKIFYALFSGCLFFIFIIVCLKGFIKHSKPIRNFAILCTPVIFIIPGAVEGRFFIAVHLMISTTLCLNTDWKNLKHYLWDKKITLIILFIFFASFLLSMWSNFLALEHLTNIFM